MTEERLRGLRVLVVDDVAELRYLLDRWLTAAGADVIVSDSAREAIELARQHRPALALVDLFMPGRGGFFLLNRLRQLRAELGLAMPIVAITSYRGPEAREVALRAGFDAFVERPISPEPLVDELRRIGFPGAAPTSTERRSAG